MSVCRTLNRLMDQSGFYYKADCMEYFMSCLMNSIEKDNLFVI